MSEELKPIVVGQELFYILKGNTDHIRVVKVLSENEVESDSYEMQFTNRNIYTVHKSKNFRKNYFHTIVEALAERKARVKKEYEDFQKNMVLQEEIFNARSSDAHADIVRYSEI